MTFVKRTIRPTEHQEQVAVIQWWASYAPTRKIDPRLLFAIPNAAKRSYALAAAMKKEGLRSGVPDLILAIPKRYYLLAGKDYGFLFSGLFIEMKRKGEKARPAQLDFADLLRTQGYNVVIAQGFEEAQRAIKSYIEL